MMKKEQEALDKFWSEAERVNHRGPVDVEALIAGTLPEGTPGIGPVIEVTEAMVKYNHSKYEQENPIYNDVEYAKKSGVSRYPCILYLWSSR